MVDLQQIGELQAMAGRVAGLQATIHGWGDPLRLAGDPGALRDQAGAHRSAASDLQAALDQGRGRATAVTASSWQGAASLSFAGFWAQVDGQVGGLASRHVEVATVLDDIAGRAETLNRQVTEVVASIEAWLSAAVAAVARLDVAAVPALVGAGAAILSRWEALFTDLEAFASSLPGRLNVDLSLTLPTPWPTPIDGSRPVDVPLPGLPGLPGLLITTPGPRGPRILITTPAPKDQGILITTPGWKEPGIPITSPVPRGPSVVTAQSDRPGVPDPEDIPPGSTPEDVIDKLPPYIAEGGEPSRKGGGVRYPDPDRPGDQVIIEPGDPSASDPLHQGPYVKISKGGQVTRVPLRGNPAL